MNEHCNSNKILKQFKPPDSRFISADGGLNFSVHGFVDVKNRKQNQYCQKLFF